MNRNMGRVAAVAMALGLLLLGTAGGYWWARRDAARQAGMAASDADAKRQVLYWYDPMAPGQRFDKPGKSPFMDMPLQPKYADEVQAGDVAIDASVRQNLGIRTVEVKKGRIAGSVRVPGTITWDLRQERVVSAPVAVIVQRLFVRAPYARVRAGQTLASVLAPEWNSAIAEANALAQADSVGARDLQSAAQQRLRALGVPRASSRNGAIAMMAPVSGVVSEIAAREGQAVPAGTLLFRVNGTDTVWLEASMPQALVAHTAAGTPVVASVNALPGRRFTGRVEALLPQLDPASRTQAARIVLDNREGLLAPGMFAEVELAPAGDVESPLVPTDALIGAGQDARVIVQNADGSFRPVTVRTGRSGGGFTEIRAGLAGGERVVASGQFLIDSEASLTGALERLGEPSASASMQPGAQVGPTDHSQHVQAPEPAAGDHERPMPDRTAGADDHSRHRQEGQAPPADHDQHDPAAHEPTQRQHPETPR